MQLTELLYLVAEEVDGERGFGQIARRVTEKFGRNVSADNVRFLVENKLRTIGVLAEADGSSPQLEKADPMLALNLRTGVIPEGVVHAITTIFYPLFFPPVIVAVLGALGALDFWLFFVHGVSQSAREIAYQPILFLMVFGLVILSTAFHEFGHASACRYGGATPGVIGVGIYLVYPAFFSDVTDVYRLDRIGRIRTDLGGIYFNMIFSLLTAGAYFITGFEPLLAIIVIQHLEMVHQLLPFLRLDGYYVVADLTGVPDLFSRIRPILRSLLPNKNPDTSVTALKPWVRVVVTAWVLSIVPILLYLFAVMAVSTPRIFATAYDSFFVQYDKVASAFSAGELARVAAGSIQMVFLVLPLAGMTYSFGRVGKNLGTTAWRKTKGKPALRTALASVALVSIGLTAFTWLPNGDYKPIQASERGTIQGGLEAIRNSPSGGSVPTPGSGTEPNGATTLREQPATQNDANSIQPQRDPTKALLAKENSQQSEPDTQSSGQSSAKHDKKQVTQPAVQQETTQPAVQQETTQPAVQQETTQPAVQQGVPQSASQETSQPTVQQGVSQPAVQETSQPAVQPEVSQTAVQQQIQGQQVPGGQTVP